jgi:arylsulfatase A-like enzyme
MKTLLYGRIRPWAALGAMATVLVWSMLWPGAGEAVARAKPNIVLLVGDDLGYGELGVYGGDIPTPNLDALARSGVRLTDGYVSAPLCTPSRAGLMTGRYQERFGLYANPPDAPAAASPGLPPSEITIARALRDRGYATGVVGKWHLGRRPESHPLKLGFDEFFGFLDSQHSYFGEEPGDPGNPIYRGRVPMPEPEYLTRAFAREAVDFIHRHAGQPFFLYAPFSATHLPLQAEPQMLARFSYIANEKRRRFAAMLTHLDEAVEQDTLVEFLGDNGCITSKSSCRNTPLRGTKFALWEGGIRVPFLLSWPGAIRAGQTYRQPVSALDLLPTSLGAAAGDAYADAGLDGIDLLPFLTGRSKGVPHDYLFWGSRSSGAVRKGDWKLLDLQGSPIQLFNLRTDIAETTNVAAANPSIVAELRSARAAWVSKLQPALW